MDLRWINNNYKQRLAKRARYCSVTRINKMPENKRYAILICLCRQLYEETIDYIVEMLIKLFDKAEKSANKQIDLASRKKRRDIKEILQHFKTIGTLILDTEITDDKLRKTIYKAISKKKLTKQIANTTDWLDCKYSHVFHLLKDRHSYFRKFFPIFIRHIELCNDGTFSSTQLLAAIELLKKLNDDNDNKCPRDAPVDFIPPKLKQFIINSDGTINRHCWETALLQAVRDEIKYGNLSVNKGRFFCQFDQFFMPDKLWEKERERFFKKAGFPCDAKDIKQYLTNRLHNAVDEFIRVEKTNTYAKIENDKWDLSIDEAQQFNQNEADMFCVMLLMPLVSWILLGTGELVKPVLAILFEWNTIAKYYTVVTVRALVIMLSSFIHLLLILTRHFIVNPSNVPTVIQVTFLMVFYIMKQDYNC